MEDLDFPDVATISTPIETPEDRIKDLEVRVDDLEETVQALWHLLHAGVVQINSIDKTLDKLTGEDQ